MPATETDITLLRRYTDHGDAEAFAVLVQRHRDMVFAVAVRVLGDSQRAEDVVQEAFGRLMRQPEGVTRSVAAWLHKATTRLAIDAMRREAARARRERIHGTVHARRRQETSDWSEVSTEVDAAMARLDTADRDLLVRHFLQGKTQRELARELGVSNATLCRRIRFALDALRRQLDRRGVVTSMSSIGGILFSLQAASAPGFPAALLGELGKMAMIGGKGYGTTGMTLGSKTALASVALGVVTTLGVAMMVVYFGFIYNASPPPSVLQRDTATRQALILDAPVELTEASALPAGTYVVNNPQQSEFAADKIVLFGVAEGEQITLVYGDNHVASVSRQEASKRVLAQTGQTLEQIARSDTRVEDKR